MFVVEVFKVSKLGYKIRLRLLGEVEVCLSAFELRTRTSLKPKNLTIRLWVCFVCFE